MTRILVVNVKVALLLEVEEDGELTSATMTILGGEEGTIGMLGIDGEPSEDSGRTFTGVESPTVAVPEEWDGVLAPLVELYLGVGGEEEPDAGEGGEE